MKKRMRILTFLLAGAMVFTSVSGTGMLAAATGNVTAEAAVVDAVGAAPVDLGGQVLTFPGGGADPEAGAWGVNLYENNNGTISYVTDGDTGDADVDLAYDNASHKYGVVLKQSVAGAGEVTIENTVKAEDGTTYTEETLAAALDADPDTKVYTTVPVKGVVTVDLSGWGNTNDTITAGGVTVAKTEADSIAAIVNKLNETEAFSGTYIASNENNTLKITQKTAANLTDATTVVTSAKANDTSVTPAMGTNGVKGVEATASDYTYTPGAAKIITVPEDCYTVSFTYSKESEVSYSTIDAIENAGLYRVVITGTGVEKNGIALTGRKSVDLTVAPRTVSGETAETNAQNASAGNFQIVANGTVKNNCTDSAGASMKYVIIEQDGATYMPDLGLRVVTQKGTSRSWTNLVSGTDYKVAQNTLDRSNVATASGTGTRATATGLYEAVFSKVTDGNYAWDGSTAGQVIKQKYAITRSLTSSDVFAISATAGAATPYAVVDGNILTEKDSAKEWDFTADTDGYYVTFTESGSTADVQESALQAGKTYTATFHGTGLYSSNSTVSKDFTVNAAAGLTAISTVEVDSSKTNTYTGSPVIPEVIVKDASGNIINSSYYKVVAVNNIAVNTATTGETQDVGKGNIYTDLPYYIVIGDGIHTSGTLYGNFTIVADTIANASISPIPALEYTGTVVTPNITVTYAGKELTVDTDYTVSIYEAKDENGDGVVDISNGRYAHESTDLYGNITNAGNYVVEVSGKGGKFTTVQPLQALLTVNKADISGWNVAVGRQGTITTEKAGETMDLSVDVKVTEGSKTLAASNYTIVCDQKTYSGGKYTFDIELTNAGKQNYTGSIKSVPVTIKETLEKDKNINTYVTATKGDDGKYTYAANTLVTSGSRTLQEGTDYTVLYYGANASDEATGSATTDFEAGKTYVAVVKAADGTYYDTGTDGKTVPFKVEEYNAAKDISMANVTITGTNTYNGAAQTAKVRVAIGSSVIDSTNYNVQCVDNINAGTATAVITGKNGYTGTITKEFTIDPASIKTMVLANEGFSKTYTGVAVKPTIVLGSLTAREEGTAYGLKYYNTVMENGVPAKQGGEYVKGDEISEVVNAGQYLVEVTGSGNYKDSIVELFTVSQGDLGDLNILGNDVLYTGEVVKPSFTVKTATGEDITLSENDYTLKVYSDAECSKEVQEVKEIGTYYAKLMGNGNFLPSSYKVVKFEVKEEVEKTVEEIQEELDAAKEELNTAKEELETAKKELQEAIDSNNASQAKIDELTKEVADQQAAVDDLKKQIEELQNQKAVDQKITVTKKAKTFQAKNLKSKKGTFQIKAAAQTDLSYKTMKADAKKKVTVKASGKVVVKKGTKAGTYKVKVRAVAAKTDVFNKAIKNFIVTVTVK